jgi:uncharacterized membrane protein YcaP (DUF421 family)
VPRGRTDVDVEVDDAFQRAEWRVQRWGLAGLALLAIASVLGLAGAPGTLFRVAVIYGFLLLVFRLSGKRTLAQMTSFDLVLVMVIGDATQQALIGDDFTIGTAVVAISSLVLIDVALGFVKSRSAAVDRIVDGLPLILVDRGTPLTDRMAREGVDLGDILAAGREQHGLRGLDEIDFAVLERSGGLSIVARRRQDDEAADR